MSDTLTDREALQALLDGEELVDSDGIRYRLRDSLEHRSSSSSSAPWYRTFVGDNAYAARSPFRRPAPEPATFADAIPHLLAGRRVRRAAWGLDSEGWRIARRCLVYAANGARLATFERESLASTDWLVEIDDQWVSAKTEVGE